MITKPKGTNDILPVDARNWVKLEETIRRVCKIYNYKEIRTPIFEKGELFHRNVNESSDMVTKETYDFYDRNNDMHTLRPEGTAGVVRAFIENKLHGEGIIQKLFYLGPMFRYERPQKGRSRQFHQFGCEAIGSSSPVVDAEVISLACSIIKSFGLKGINVKINTLGDEESRGKYKDVLVEYFKNYYENLCTDCKNRLEKNPLRTLDCKECVDKDFFKNAPKIKDFLSQNSINHFNKVLEALDKMSIKYEIKDNLVRGLDYYTHTVFEVEVDIKDFGAQNVICAGGRYDNLVSDLGGVNSASCGFAFGLERLLMALEAEEKKLLPDDFNYLYIISLGEKANLEALKIANVCRLGGLSCDIDFQNRSLKSQFNIADKFNSKYIAILGDNELEQGVINIKDKEGNTQETISILEVYPYILKKIKEKVKSPCVSCKEGESKNE